MPLKDTLKLIADKSGMGSMCKFGKIYSDMDAETKDALRSAMTSSASTMDICRALMMMESKSAESSWRRKESASHQFQQHQTVALTQKVTHQNDNKKAKIEHCKTS
jgi:hypothetical protein